MRLPTLLLILLLVCGCRTATVVFESWPPEAPRKPLVAASQVEEINGITYWKGTTNSFTGRTVAYDGGFFHEGFVSGNEAIIPEEPEHPVLYPDEAPYQQAVRDFVCQNGPNHDTYLFFQQHGNQDDIPALLYGLQSMGETTNRAVVCTRIHCVDALQSITSARPGINYSDWVKWWTDKYETEPPKWTPRKK
jgi:hypothetical protein